MQFPNLYFQQKDCFLTDTKTAIENDDVSFLTLKGTLRWKANEE